MSYGSKEPVPVVGCLLARNDLLNSIARRNGRHTRRMIGWGLLSAVAFGGTAWIGEDVYQRFAHGEFGVSEIIPGSAALILLVLSGLFARNAIRRYQDSTAAKAEYDKEAERPIPYW